MDSKLQPSLTNWESASKNSCQHPYWASTLHSAQTFRRDQDLPCSHPHENETETIGRGKQTGSTERLLQNLYEAGTGIWGIPRIEDLENCQQFFEGFAVETGSTEKCRI